MQIQGPGSRPIIRVIHFAKLKVLPLNQSLVYNLNDLSEEAKLTSFKSSQAVMNKNYTVETFQFTCWSQVIKLL